MRSPPLLGIGHQPRRFLVELALQVLGVGRNPHRRMIARAPRARRAPDSPASCRARFPLRRAGCCWRLLSRGWKAWVAAARIVASVAGAAPHQGQAVVEEALAPPRARPRHGVPGGRPPSSSHSSIRSQTLRPVAKVATSSFGIGLEQRVEHRPGPGPVGARRGSARSPPSRGSPDSAVRQGARAGRRRLASASR